VTLFYVLIGIAVAVAIVAAWRVLVHDKTIRKVRLGFFYERERDDDERI